MAVTTERGQKNGLGSTGNWNDKNTNNARTSFLPRRGKKALWRFPHAAFVWCTNPLSLVTVPLRQRFQPRGFAADDFAIVFEPLVGVVEHAAKSPVRIQVQTRQRDLGDSQMAVRRLDP